MRLLAGALALACAALFAVVLSAHAEAPAHESPTCDGLPAAHHIDRAFSLLERAHDPKRILDPSPAKSSEKEAWREHKLCVYDRERRARVAEKAERTQRVFARLFATYISPPGMAYLDGLGACEADGDYWANTGNGFMNRYQFDAGTWATTAAPFHALTGVAPNPSRLAAPREQDIRAAILYRSRGSAPWPSCG